ncbi:MAG: FtsW/RodA/SpoVE family cell cycle protein [Clostridia bacterium]|nr:FtsW/RodA/SpoVE family cell cycle protein [Clostridia bacterium]
MKNKIKSFNYPMFLIICILLCIGLITLASSSSYSALNDYQDSLYYFKRQIIFALLGIFVMLAVSRIDYNIYRKFSYIGYIIGIALMLMVFVPRNW